MRLLNGRQILILEDECLLADELCDAVRSAGGKIVGPFAYVGEALEGLWTRVDAAVLNVRVRDGTSYAVAALLRQRGTPVIFATGQQRQAERWHGSLWIDKPYDPQDVIEGLCNVI